MIVLPPSESVLLGSNHGGDAKTVIKQHPPSAYEISSTMACTRNEKMKWNTRPPRIEHATKKKTATTHDLGYATVAVTVTAGDTRKSVVTHHCPFRYTCQSYVSRSASTRQQRSHCPPLQVISLQRQPGIPTTSTHLRHPVSYPSSAGSLRKTKPIHFRA